MVTLVLLPGMDGTGRLFAPLVEAIGGALATVIVRYPVEGEQTYARLTDLAAQALPSDGPLLVLGESFSGPIAVSLAARYPSRIAGLALCCTFVSNPRPAAGALMAIAGRIPLPPPRFIAFHALLGEFQTPALRAGLQDALAEVPAAVLGKRLREVARVDVSADLRRLAVPVLYLRAEQDRVVPPAAARRVQAACPDTRIVDVRGPHCLLQAAPEVTARELIAFARGLSRSG